jgi:tetratricopeptide (TPR) repeat protein
MLYSNLGSESKCLEQAHVAVALYRQTEDSRGIARALSQVASRYATAQRWAEAEAVAREALQRARESGDRRLVADVLRRCAQAFAAQGEQSVRERYAQSVALFRALGRNDDTSRALQWWGQWENTVGCYNEAADRLLEAADLNERDTWQMFVVNDIASCYLAAGDRERAEPFARRALTLATKARHEILGSLAISFLAVIGSARDARTAARLLGHAQERLRAAGWNLQPPDDATIASLRAALELELERDDLGRLLSEGAAYSEERAVADALAL